MGVAMPWLFLLACQSQNGLVKGTPSLVVQPADIAFGEVVVGRQSEIGITLENRGYGALAVEDLALDPLSSPDFELVSYPEAGIPPRSEAFLAVRYRPDAEGQDLGAVTFLTDDPAHPEVRVELSGMGTQPRIEVDPELLYFGTVPAGGSVALPFTVTAAGSGDLVIDTLTFDAVETAAAYAVTLPEAYAEPYTLAHGLAFQVVVTFTPPTDEPYEGALVLASNDPEAPMARVDLRGNTVDDPTTNEPPRVEILSPHHGEYYRDSDELTLEGQVWDPDEAASRLFCGWYADSTPIAVTLPGEDGRIRTVTTLPDGEYPLVLRCVDSEGASGEDRAELVVWPAEEPMAYTLSGGDSVFDYFGVDDDISVYLDGVAIYADVDGTRSTLPPVTFEASPGATLRILATDQNYCDLGVDALVLHWGTGSSQPLNDEVCRSACPDHACYDPTFAGPWPGVFLDETFTISIP